MVGIGVDASGGLGGTGVGGTIGPSLDAGGGKTGAAVSVDVAVAVAVTGAFCAGGCTITGCMAQA
jgi:hypothetical protein